MVCPVSHLTRMVAHNPHPAVAHRSTSHENVFNRPPQGLCTSCPLCRGRSLLDPLLSTPAQGHSTLGLLVLVSQESLPLTEIKFPSKYSIILIRQLDTHMCLCTHKHSCVHVYVRICMHTDIHRHTQVVRLYTHTNRCT